MKKTTVVCVLLLLSLVIIGCCMIKTARPFPHVGEGCDLLTKLISAKGIEYSIRRRLSDGDKKITDPNNRFFVQVRRMPGNNLNFFSGFSSLNGLTVRNAKNIEDISGLNGCPLEFLYLLDGKFTDISCLAGMPLIELSLSGCAVRDLEVVRGMKLKVLDVNNTSIVSLDALKGMDSLVYLDIGNTQIADFTPLEGMHLDWLILPDVSISEFMTLQNTSVENLVLPAGYRRNMFNSPNITHVRTTTERPLASIIQNETEGLGVSFSDAVARDSETDDVETVLHFQGETNSGQATKNVTE